MYTRIEISVDVTAEPSNRDAFDATMIELSAGGMSVEQSPPLPEDTDVICTFYDESHNMISIRGVVSWAKEDCIGIRFTGYDTPSYLRFKDFLLDHAHDPHQVENEFLLNLDTLPEPD